MFLLWFKNKKEKMNKKSKMTKRKELALDDNSFMPFGEFKGHKMANVPSKRLLWYWDNQNRMTKQNYPEVYEYIENNLDVIKEEVYRETLDRRCDATESDIY